MHDERHALTDTALDREIERLLAVAPSPELVARVRTRIASEPSPSGWRFGWRIAAVAAVTAAVVIAVVVARNTRPPITSPVPLAARAVTDSASNSLPSVVSTFGRTVGGPGPSGRGATAGPKGPALRVALHVPEAKPLIDAREANALRSLIAGVRDGRLDLSPLLQPAPRPPMDLPSITDIVIPPITIEPIAPVDGAQGERQ